MYFALTFLCLFILLEFLLCLCPLVCKDRLFYKALAAVSPGEPQKCPTAAECAVKKRLL